MIRELWVYVNDANNHLAIATAFFGLSNNNYAVYNAGGGWYRVNITDNSWFWVDANGYAQVYAYSGTSPTIYVSLPPVAWPAV